jgi:hypothetical protein
LVFLTPGIAASEHKTGELCLPVTQFLDGVWGKQPGSGIHHILDLVLFFFFFETLGFELKTLHFKTTGLFSDSSNIC